MAAGRLRPGDSLLNREGAWVKIESVEKNPSPVAVYNLEVEDNHDYFVGSDGIIVHNGCDALKALAEQVTSRFGNLECVPCSEALVNAFKSNGIVGKVITLTAKEPKGDFIFSEFFASEAISTNGSHIAVEVDGIVFDNISGSGIARADWEASLSTQIGDFSQSFNVSEKPF